MIYFFISLGTSTPNIKESGQESLMTRSLDPSVLKSTTQRLSSGTESCLVTPNSMSRSVHLPLSEVNSFVQSPPLPAASTMLPILDSLPSPLTPSIPKSRPVIGLQTPAGEESRAPTLDKLQMIKNKASQMNDSDNKGKKIFSTLFYSVLHCNYVFIVDFHHSAIVIQKMWRGYRTRNLNKNVAKVYQHVQMLRFNQYIK